MPEIPDCLNRRYMAIDELIQDISSLFTQGNSQENFFDDMTNGQGIKMMCNFWKILKENPECDLSQAVKQSMGVHTPSSLFQQPVSCFIADNCSKSTSKESKRDNVNKSRNVGCSSKTPRQSPITPNSRTPKSKSQLDLGSLNKVLSNLKEAASFDKKCNDRIMELMDTQKELQVQTQNLEHREKAGIQLLKEADCMWSSMEEAYKKKIADSMDRQKELLSELIQVEKNNSKWRKNKKDLEVQMDNVTKYHQEIVEKIAQKQNDLKCMNTEMDNLKQKIESNKLIADGSKKVMSNKKEASENKISSIADEITKLTTTLAEVQRNKRYKEQDGQKYVKDARNDLQKMSRVLLQKKIENENLIAETEGLDEEINYLKQSSDQCHYKCQTKHSFVNEEIKTIDKLIAEFEAKCIRCNQCIDTHDAKKLCGDCLRCREEIECKTDDDDPCDKEPVMDCVCISVKEKFLENVFENMYTVLEKQSKSPSGKAVAEVIIKSLKNSRNGKLDAETRQLIQAFVLSTVNKNINLTIIGGAVKTRCEMDPEIYQQLMLCLKQEKVEKPPKVDKGTVSKKACCHRWGGTSECNCPDGANSCACAKRAPVKELDPPVQDNENSMDRIESGMLLRPNSPSTSFDQTHTRDCAMHAVPSAVGTEKAMSQKCNNPTGTLSGSFSLPKNMRAAQCVLGLESLSAMPKGYIPSIREELAFIPEISDSITCDCETIPSKHCLCKDRLSRPREVIIDEVMGSYSEIATVKTAHDGNRLLQKLLNKYDH